MTYSELYALRIRQLCQNRGITINNQNEPPSEKAMKTSQALKQRKE